ncbi:MAG: hypothetical protein WCH85_10475 [Methanomicrobiales archaeon]
MFIARIPVVEWVQRMRILTLEGWIIGLFVIFNGIYVISFPPTGDEPQGYAIVAIGIFIILAALHLDKTMEQDGESPPMH